MQKNYDVSHHNVRHHNFSWHFSWHRGSQRSEDVIMGCCRKIINWCCAFHLKKALSPWWPMSVHHAPILEPEVLKCIEYPVRTPALGISSISKHLPVCLQSQDDSLITQQLLRRKLTSILLRMYIYSSLPHGLFLHSISIKHTEQPCLVTWYRVKETKAAHVFMYRGWTHANMKTLRRRTVWVFFVKEQLPDSQSGSRHVWPQETDKKWCNWKQTEIKLDQDITVWGKY